MEVEFAAVPVAGALDAEAAFADGVPEPGVSETFDVAALGCESLADAGGAGVLSPGLSSLSLCGFGVGFTAAGGGSCFGG